MFPVLVQASHDISCRQVRNGNENLKKEIRCIKLVKHTNVIKLYDTVDEDDKVYLIFELANFLSLQDLCDWVRDHGIRDPTTQEDKKCLPFPNVRLLLKQLLQGLQACHSKVSAASPLSAPTRSRVPAFTGAHARLATMWKRTSA